jgi:hypothetical protein
MSTTIDTPLTEDERESLIADHRLALEQIDRSLNAVTVALHRMREVRTLATDLDGIVPARLVIAAYSPEEPWESPVTDLGLATSTQDSLQGAYREPVRDLIAATHAAEAKLISYGAQAEEDRARIERELSDLRG